MVISTHSNNASAAASPSPLLREHQDGRWEAILPASNAAAQQEVKHILASPKGQDWLAFADVLDGLPVIRIQGIKEKTDLLPTLKKQYAKISTQTLEERGLKRTKQSFRDKTLRYSGFAELLGDAAFISKGISNKNHHYHTAAGASYLSSALLLTRYGKQSRHEKLGLLAGSLRKHLKKEGLNLNHMPLNGKAIIESGLLEKVENYLKLNAHQVKLLANLFGSVCFLGGSVKDRTPANTKESNLQIGSAILVVMASIAALILPDRHKPLVVAGTTSFVSNLGMAGYSVTQHLADEKRIKSGDIPADQAKTKRTENWSNYALSASFLTSNAFFAMSSKSGPSYQSYEQDTLAIIAAGMLAQEPHELTQPIIQETAKFIAKKSGNKLSVKELSETLTAKIESLRQHPFLSSIEREGQNLNQQASL